MTEPLPSARIDPAALDAARDEVVETLRDLIRIPSVNPPPADAPDGRVAPSPGRRQAPAGGAQARTAKPRHR